MVVANLANTSGPYRSFFFCLTRVFSRVNEFISKRVFKQHPHAGPQALKY